MLPIVFLGMQQSVYAVDFHSINNIYHISIRETNSVVKDDNGFVWISSRMGILRLTSDDCRTYQLPYEKMNMVYVKMVFSQGILLTYNYSGQIFTYNATTDRFEPCIDIAQSIDDNGLTISKLLIDNNKQLWISTSKGLMHFDGEQLATIDSQGPIDNIEWIDDSTLFVARRHDMQILNTSSRKTTKSISQPIENLIKSSLHFNRKDGQMWIGTKANGLFMYDLKADVLKSINVQDMPKQPILALEPMNDSILLIGYDGQGVWKLDCNSHKVLEIYKNDNNNPNSLQGNGVYGILCEPDNKVWICTYSNGVSFFNIEPQVITRTEHKINNNNSLSDNNVNCIIEDRNGNIWLATNNGINRYNPHTGKWLRALANEQGQSQVFLSVCEDANGNIWAGTYSSGVYVLDCNGRLLSHFSSKFGNTNYSNDFVFDIMKDCQDNIWIGGVNDNVFRHNSKSGKFDEYEYVPLNTFAELDDQHILLGCVNGLIMADKETDEKKVLIDRVIINDILVWKEYVWTATNGNGLLKLNMKTNETEKFDVSSGLPSNFVTSILYANGYLWLGTESGLCKFNPTTNKTLVFTNVTQLSSVSYNRGAKCTLSNGDIIFGTNKGALQFNPTKDLEKQSKGKIFLQDITVAGRSLRQIKQLEKPIDKLEKLTLDYTQNTMRVELVPIGNIAGPKFSWKLEGLDNDWNQPTSDRTINYSNIPNKNFKLHIRLYDNTMASIIDERIIVVSVTPPFWRRWWFLLACYIIVGLGVFIMISQYIANLKRQHAEDKIRFFTNTAHDMRTSLTLIKAPIEELQNEVKLSAKGTHFLDIATRQVKQLSLVVTQLMDFQKTDIGKETLMLENIELVAFIDNKLQMFESLAKKNKCHIEFKHNLNSYQTAVDSNMVGKILDNLISNAIKYSPDGGDIEVRLDCNNSVWKLAVTDHGIGISEKAQRHLFREFYRSENAINTKVIGSGIGLMLVKNYVTLHDGSVNCTSKENAGSTFSIEIPHKNIDSLQIAEAKRAYVDIKANNTKAEPASETETKSDIRLMIVEDNDTLRDFMKEVLSQDFTVLSAENGAIAWQTIQEQQPDIIISDIMMPEMDGFELCRQVKSTFETAHIPLILLTALSEQTEQLHGLGLGADDYLTKPFDTAILRQRIKSILQNRKATRETILNNMATESPSTVILGNSQNDKFIGQLYKVVKDNMSNCDFDKEQFASAMNVSSSLLYKKIKALTDQSPTDFIKTVRLEHAMALLKQKEQNITEISEICGFASAGYFSTVFKKQYGISPSELAEKKS